MNRFLALMIYVAVFLGGFTLTASLGMRGFVNSTPPALKTEHISRVILDDENELGVARSEISSFKIVVKKKIKKRYQVRYCEYQPTPEVFQKHHVVYDDVVVHCILRSVIHERCIRTFGLRGPPAYSIA